MKKANLHTDGGARGNPGPAAIGYYLEIDGEEPIGRGERIGETTNNVAEYKALIAGMRLALENGVTHLACFLDSELVVKQMQGKYRVKNGGLIELFGEAKKEAAKFAAVAFNHVPREKNKQADALVNMALDKRM